MSARAPRSSRTHVGGMPIFLESHHALPVVDVSLRIATGSQFDPMGLEGLVRLTNRTMRRGPRGMSEERTEDMLAGLGGRLHAATSRRSLRISGTVLERHLDAFFGLMTRLVREPAMRAADFARQRRETQATLMALFDDDDSLASQHFRRRLFGAHPFARSQMGHAGSLPKLNHRVARDFWQTHLTRGNLAFGFAGDITAERAEALVAAHFGDLPAGKSKRPSLKTARLQPGRRVLVLDKPERTQTTMILGTLGSKLGDPHLDGLIVANTVFGGTFASRLNNELRTKRGFTYGAGSHVGRAERREAWAMQSSPEAEHTVACAAAHMELMEQWVERGITKRELSSAKRYLRGAFGFDVETPSKRLDIRLERYSAGLDPEAFVGYPERMRAVTLKQANDAVRARLDPNALTVVVVAEAEKVRAGLEALPGVRSVEVLPFTTPVGE